MSGDEVDRLGVAELERAQQVRAGAKKLRRGPSAVGQPATDVGRLGGPPATAVANRSCQHVEADSSIASSWLYASSSISGAQPWSRARPAVIKMAAA